MTDDGGKPRGSPGQAFARVVGAASAAWFATFGVWGMVALRSFFERFATFKAHNQHPIEDIGTGAHVASHAVGRDLGGRPEADIPVFAVLAALLVAACAFNWAASRGGIRALQ